jgi:accessory gene regulator B
MYKKFSGKVVEALSESGLITKDSAEIYQFGLESALLKFIHVATMLFVGICFNMVLETVAFIVSYSALRVYAGGYHAQSSLRCYCISWLMIISVLLLVKICSAQIMFTASIFITIPSFIVIYILVPVENMNKPLDDIEKHYYRKISRIILVAELSILVVLLFFNIIQVMFTISLSLFSLAIMLVLGKIQISNFT